MYWVSEDGLGKAANYAAIGAFCPMTNGYHLLSWDHQTILIFNSRSVTNQHIFADVSIRDGAGQATAGKQTSFYQSVHLTFCLAGFKKNL